MGEVSSYTNLFADDAKIIRKIRVEEDFRKLQEDIDKIHNWSKKWEMELNVKKCKVLEMWKGNTKPSWNYKMRNDTIEKMEDEKDQES